MINPICNNCGNELNEFGGILLSPPNKEFKETIEKYYNIKLMGDIIIKSHLCIKCYNLKI